MDSRVAIAAFSKGRSSAHCLNRLIQSALPFLLAANLVVRCIHVGSEFNPADNPSRGKPVAAPSRQTPLWLDDVLKGQCRRFDCVLKSDKFIYPLGRWVRLLLLLAGDIEPNPGPRVAKQ
eukprot:6488240-Amphidinium_carterae.1